LRPHRLIIVLAAVIVLGACSAERSDTTGQGRTSSVSPPGSSTEPGKVVIHTFAFEPQTISVTAGTTVTWTNQDAILHTVTAGTSAKPGTMFDSKLDGIGSTFDFTFSKPGSYPYHCSIHEVMQGVVNVT
jgi:plastocyanin